MSVHKLLALGVALALGGAVASGCKKNGAGPGVRHPALTATDQSRDRLLITVVVPSLDRTFATVDGLQAKHALPFGSQELRGMMFARLEIPESAAKLVDTAQPMAMAVLARPKAAGAGAAKPGSKPANKEAAPGDEPYAATAVGLKSADAAAALVTALGTPAGKQKDVEQVRRADGSSLWILRLGAVVAMADSLEALADAGAHALEARREASDDILVSGFPRALARAGDLDLSGGPEGIKRRALEEYDRAQAKQGRGPAPPAERASLEATLDFFMPALTEASVAELGVALAAERGVRLVLRVRPAAGSAFARRVAARAPYEVDPRLLAGETPVSMGAVGASPSLLQLYQGILDAQARSGVKGAAEVAAKLRPVLGQLTGAMGVSFRPVRGAFAYDVVLPLKAGVTTAAAVDALAALAGSPALPAVLREGYGRDAPAIKVARQGAELRTELVFAGDRPGSPGAVARALYGSSTIVLLASAQGGRLLISSEPGAKGRLEALAGPAPAPRPAPPLQAALDETRGLDGFGYVDLWGLLRPVLGAALSGPEAQMVNGLLAMPGLSRLSLPISVSFAGGDQLTADLRIPLSTLTNAATALSLFGGLGGGALSPGP
jgi:hypothetical protein